MITFTKGDVASLTDILHGPHDEAMHSAVSFVVQQYGCSTEEAIDSIEDFLGENGGVPDDITGQDEELDAERFDGLS